MGPDLRSTRFFDRVRTPPTAGRRGRLCALLAGAVLVPLVAWGVPGPAGATTGTTGATPAAAPSAATSTAVRDQAYWLVATDGGIFSFGGAPFYGSMGGQHLNQPIVGMASTPTHGGYWEVASDGGIFTFGNAGFHGSMGGSHLNKPIVGMAADPATGGYWEVASDGGIFSFTAPFYGSMGGSYLNKPIVGMATMPTGHGYWEVASDGGIFSFGTAVFHGSTGAMTLNQPIIGMTATPTGGGYWLVASDGGIFTFGSASYMGSLGGTPQPRPIVAIAALALGKGYWMTNNNGAITNFGTATYWGSAPQVLNQPVVGMALATGNGDPGSPSYHSGSFGYDISWPQCSATHPATPQAPLPRPNPIGIVGVEGRSFGPVNPCLAAEVAWAAGGLNLYTALSYGTTPTSADPACNTRSTAPNPTACNYGFNAALDAYHKAVAVIGSSANVPWWLDIEPAGQWIKTATANRSVVQGALDALRSVGINTVGYYFSAALWNTMVGNFNPPGPLWVAWYQETPQYICATSRSYWAAHGDTFPSGPVQITQYSSPTFPYQAGGLTTAHFDNDYAC